MLRLVLSLTFGQLVLVLQAAESHRPQVFDAGDIATVRATFHEAVDALTEHYQGTRRLGADFRTRAKEIDRALGKVQSHAEANAIIGDFCATIDPRIRFYPPSRRVRIDYGWNWSLIGNTAHVSHLDTDGAAREGLQLGDQVLAIEGVQLDRTSYVRLLYLFYTLAPRPALRVEIRRAAEPARLIVIPSTARPPYSSSLTPTEAERAREREFRDVSAHLRRRGPVLIWVAKELQQPVEAINPVIKALRYAEDFVIDLRGLAVSRHEPVLAMLDAMFADTFDLGKIERPRFDVALRVRGTSKQFAGVVIVLIDAHTSGFAELLARTIQQRQRGVLVGDRTMGRVFEPRWFPLITTGNPVGPKAGDPWLGRSFDPAVHHMTSITRGDFQWSMLFVPFGELRLADSTQLDGRGVAPDLQLLPKPEDLAGDRDIVLAKALEILKQSVSPEEAYRLFDRKLDDDETM